MNLRKRILYIILAIILLFSIIVRVSYEMPYLRIDKSIAMMYIKIAEWFSGNEMYEVSNFYYKIAKKASSKTIWLDYNIAKNTILECWDMPKSEFRDKKLYESIDRLYIELKKHPNHSHILAQLGHAYYLLENYDSSIKYYELTLKRDPSWTYGLNQLAYIYSNAKNDSKTALKYIERSMDIDKGKFDNYFLYGWILSDLDRNEDAVNAYKKNLEKYPNNVATLVNISGCEISLRDFENAEKHVDHGLELNRYSSYLLRNKIKILLHKNQIDEAEKIAKQINNGYEYNGYIGYWQLANIERYRGNKKLADEYYEKSKENAQEYYYKFCEKNYDLSDKDGNCSNRYQFLKSFDEDRYAPLNF